MPRNISTLESNPNLDVLRSFAVISVCIAHGARSAGLESGTASIGLLGVLIFFVHTSLVLMASMERLELSGFRLVFSFYLRRIFRIYPLSIICVLALVALRMPPQNWDGATFITPSPVELISNLALVQNLTASRDLLLPMWSLPYEIQMYIMLPFVFILLKRAPGLLTVSLLWLSSALIAYVLPASAAADFMGYAPCFLSGAIAFVIFKQRQTVGGLPAWSWPVTIGGFFIAFLVLNNVGASYVSANSRKWLVCLPLGLLLAHFQPVRAGWLRSASHFVAKYSYGIYLGHMFALHLAFRTLTPLPLGAKVGVFLVSTAGLAVFLYHAVESPMIGVGKRVAGSLVPTYGQVHGSAARI